MTAGVAINPTDLRATGVIDPDDASLRPEMVLVMSVNPGFSGSRSSRNPQKTRAWRQFGPTCASRWTGA